MHSTSSIYIFLELDALRWADRRGYRGNKDISERKLVALDPADHVEKAPPSIRNSARKLGSQLESTKCPV